MRLHLEKENKNMLYFGNYNLPHQHKSKVDKINSINCFDKNAIYVHKTKISQKNLRLMVEIECI
jgi:hypothetical protein